MYIFHIKRSKLEALNIEGHKNKSQTTQDKATHLQNIFV